VKIQMLNLGPAPGYAIAAAYAQGSGDLLLCIHALGCSHHSFRDWENQSALRSFTFLAPDLLGFGASDRSDSFSYTMEDHAEICAELLGHFDYERLHIVAHSMGGAIALLLPPDLLDSAESFANIEGNLTPADCGIASRRAADVSFEQFQADVLPDFKIRFARYASLDMASPYAYYRSSQSRVQWSDSAILLDKFLNLRCRSCYIYGDENRGQPSIAATRTVQQIEVPNSGHFPMEDNPTGFYAALATFCANTY
jgi:pimeloyl-ACP methyl ester carboxylesterase